MTAPRSDKWMPLYIGDYHKDTQRLTTLQHGAYLLLILDYWVGGPLPDDDEQLAAVTKMAVKDWKKIRPTIARFFQIEGGAWHHKRIDKELERAALKTGQRSEAGKKSAEVRWGKRGNGNGNGEGDETGNGDITSVTTNVVTDGVTNGSRKNAPSPSPSEDGSNEPSKYESFDREFDAWYGGYPRHEGRGQALKAYRAARRSGATVEQLTEGRDRYARACRGKDRQFIRLPATWLNGQGWLDETQPSEPLFGGYVPMHPGAGG